jgi:LuxR family transcriptional regulator, maltose regulon positive regulatory protein
MEKADQTARHPSCSPPFRAMHAANRVMLAIQQDDMDAALDWGHRLSEYPDNILGIWYQHVPPRLLIARGEKTTAAAQLQVLYKRVAPADAQGFIIKIRVYQALAAATPDEALTFLAEALKMGQPEGFIRTFVDEGRLLAPLLHRALAQGILPEYTGQLLTIIESEERQRRKMQKGEGSPSAYHTLLSERELEVLQLIASGLSNQQIADRLIISLSTAKNHVHNILEKLDVQGRTEAVAQARELELI